MATSLGAMALAAVLGIGPFGHGGVGCPTCGPGGYYSAVPSAGYVDPAAPSAGALATAFPSAGGVLAGAPAMGVAYGSGSSFDQLNPYDAPSPWMHGYFQHMPVYGGFRSFRPYNYKHALSQSTTAGQWGMSPVMPYSQQFWHRYQDKASLKAPASANAQATFAAEYARELARLKAWRDFQASQGAGPALQTTGIGPGPTSAVPGSAGYGTAARGYEVPAGTPANAPSSGVWPNPAVSGPMAPPPAPLANPSVSWPVPAAGTPGAATSSAAASSAAMMLPPAPKRLNPTGFGTGAQIEQLQQQVQEQARQIQALQSLLNQQSGSGRSWGSLSTWSGPSRWNPAPRGY